MANKEMTAEQTTAEVKKDTIDAPALEKRSLTASILTIDSDRAVETQENVEDTIWHDLQNAYRTKKILTDSWAALNAWRAAEPLPLSITRNSVWQFL